MIGISTPQETITEWLINNELTIDELIQDLNQEVQVMLSIEPEFEDDIIDQYRNRVQSIVGEEISRQTGLPFDIILETFETIKFNEHFSNV